MVAVGIERIEKLKVSQPTPGASSFIQSSQTGTLSAGPSADTSVTYAPARQGVFLGPWIMRRAGSKWGKRAGHGNGQRVSS